MSQKIHPECYLYAERLAYVLSDSKYRTEQSINLYGGIPFWSCRYKKAPRIMTHCWKQTWSINTKINERTWHEYISHSAVMPLWSFSLKWQTMKKITPQMVRKVRSLYLVKQTEMTRQSKCHSQSSSTDTFRDTFDFLKHSTVTLLCFHTNPHIK